MKKIIIFVLALLLTACGNVSKTPLTKVNGLKTEKEVLYEIDNNFNVDNESIDVFDIDDQYAYIRIWDFVNKKYDFYRYDDKLELMYRYDYSYIKYPSQIPSVGYVIDNGQLIMSICHIDRDRTYTEIFKVSNNTAHKFYELDARIHNLQIKNDRLFVYAYNQIDDISNGEVVIKGNSIFINLTTGHEDAILPSHTTYDILTGETTKDESKFETFDSDNGYIYVHDQYVYFHEYKSNQDIKLFKINNDLDKKGCYVGNDQCVITLQEDLLHFIVNEENKYKDFYISIDDIDFELNYFHGGYIDDQNYYISFSGKNQFIIFDYINKELSIYKNNDWHKSGYFNIMNGNIYCINKSEDKIIIEKCTFNKV